MTKKISLASIGIAVLLAHTASAQVLFTTTNDFGGWNDNNGGTRFILTPVTSHDSDGGTINGAGNWISAAYYGQVGATGTPGALQVQWLPAAGSYNTFFGPGGQGGDSNFLAVISQTGKILTFDYTTPTNEGGSYFSPLGIVINASSGYDQISPTSVTPLGNGWTRATFGSWSNEAAKLAANITTNGTYSSWGMEFGVIWSSNYSPSNAPFYVDNFVMRTPPPPPPIPIVLYTTTNDFTGWTTEVGVSSVAPSTFDLDGDSTNGVGNTPAPGALGTAGSLAVQWASNNFIQPFSYSPDESTNAAFIAALEQGASLTFEYTPPTNSSGSYFQLGVLVNCNGRSDVLFPTSTTTNNMKNGVTQAVIGWTTEAGLILNAQRVSTNFYLQIGLMYNSDYASTNTFYVDDIAVYTNTPTANIIGTVTLAAQSCGTNGVMNPGENDTIDLVLQNIGNADASNVVATLLATGGVTSPSGAQSYGTLLAGGDAVTNSFTFIATNGPCGGTLVASMQLTTNSVSAGTVLAPFALGTTESASNTYSTGGVSLPIPDYGTNTASIVVPDNATVQKVTVSVRLDHNYDGDVTMDLIAPDSTDVTLVSAVNNDIGPGGPGNDGQNFGSGNQDCTGTFTIFDDGASTSIDGPNAPYEGSFQPENPLSALLGKSAQGTWYLRVVDTDLTSGDTGTLYCVQLTINEQSYTCCTNAPVAPPVANFAAAPTAGAAPLAVTFTDIPSNSPTAWYWTFGDGGTSTTESPSHTYANPGSYSAQLIASNSGGASSPATQTINVYSPYAWWRLSYFTNTNSVNGAPSADPYGTGMNNTNKFLAGFSPTNSAAYLHVISIAKSAGTNVVVTYLGASGDHSWSPGITSRTNVLEFTTGSASGSYSNNFVSTGQTNVLSGGTGFGQVTSFIDTNGAASGSTRYYRVRVIVP
ncbi:MAG TPA: PKD domain-containing protein [Verrucomicrobiae bacterium]|nr:PKD domain-containing protein [Verrucomicrobiae bacterium]